MTHARAAAMTLSLLFMPASAGAQDNGDAGAGLAYVSAYCAVCHAVERGEAESPVFNAPAFDVIANSPDITGRALAVILQTPHENMPDFIIPQAERDNIITYIMSLQR